MKQDEITFDVVSGVSLNHAAIGYTVNLHTRIRDYKIFTFNGVSAKTFINYIEQRCLENTNGKRNYT